MANCKYYEVSKQYLYSEMTLFQHVQGQTEVGLETAYIYTRNPYQIHFNKTKYLHKRVTINYSL